MHVLSKGHKHTRKTEILSELFIYVLKEWCGIENNQI